MEGREPPHIHVAHAGRYAKFWLEPVTVANVRGFSTLPKRVEALAVDASCTADTLTVVLADGRTVSVPVAWFPRLLEATAKQRADWELIGGGIGIHWEAIDEDISVASLLQPENFMRLPKKGANVNSADSYGGTALQLAAGGGNDAATRMLLDAGADVGARRKGPIDYAALHYAAWTGNGATVRTLLSAGGLVNDAAGGGWTPLMIAMLYGRPDVVEALLAGGADVNKRSPAGWTALKEAEMRRHREIAERLRRAGAIDYPDGSR